MLSQSLGRFALYGAVVIRPRRFQLVRQLLDRLPLLGTPDQKSSSRSADPAH